MWRSCLQSITAGNVPEDRSLPRSLIARSRVLSLLWAHRGRRNGLTLTDLCALTGRNAKAITSQIAAARSALKRLAPRWHILEEVEEHRASIIEPSYWLVAHDCPRPPARSAAVLTGDPEIVSFTDLGDEFPGDNPRFTELLAIAKGYGHE
jgi:hypothetical protein